jgi:hypothetical protein
MFNFFYEFWPFDVEITRALSTENTIFWNYTVIATVVPLALPWRHTQYEPLKHETTYPVIECNILEAMILQQHHCENTEPYNSVIVTAGCESVQLWQLCGSAANCWSAEHLCEWPDNEQPTGQLPLQQHSVQVSRHQHQVFLALFKENLQKCIIYFILFVCLSTCKWIKW